MEHSCKKTIYACFTGYIVQAIVNNFAPLLFLTFQASYGIPLSSITLLVTLNFAIQLLVDLLCVKLADKIGYRVCMVAAHGCAALGLVLLGVLPEIMQDPFTGLLIAVIVYAMGGGLLEVLVSPVLEACPTPNKEQAMSLLHSFYCWGSVGVVLLSTLFFSLFGIENWRLLTLVWAVVPLVNGIVFLNAPIASLIPEGERGLTLSELFSKRIFWVFLLMVACAGACEHSISQWASTFAEKGLGVSKTAGDLAGPMAFAVLMGASRAFYGKFGDRIDLDRFMVGSSVLCIISFLLASLSTNAVLGLLGCALSGLSVGIMWPGTFSKASAQIKGGGTAMFALIALAGDLGCSGGPTFVGMISSRMGDNLHAGILAATVFPVLLLLGILASGKSKSRR